MRAWLAVGLILLAGCSEPAPEAEPAEGAAMEPTGTDPAAVDPLPANDTVAAPPPVLISQDCAGFVVYAPLTMEEAQGRLPDGFTPTDYGNVAGTPPTGLAQEYAFTFQCATARLDNQTFEGVQYGFAGIGATSPDAYGGVAGYTMEGFYADDAALVQALAGRLKIAQESLALDMTCAAEGVGCVGTADTGDAQTQVVPAVPQDVPPFAQDFWIVDGGEVQQWVRYNTLSTGAAQLGVGTLDNVPGIGMAVTWTGDATQVTPVDA